MALTEIFRSRDTEVNPKSTRQVKIYSCFTSEVDSVAPAINTPITAKVAGSGTITGSVLTGTTNFVTTSVVGGDTILISGTTPAGYFTIASGTTHTLTLAGGSWTPASVTFSVSPYSGLVAKHIKKIYHNPSRPAEGLIVVFYETPPTTRLATRSVGRAQLFIDISSEAVKSPKDKNGQIVEGPDLADGLPTGSKWVVVKGNSFVNRGRIQICIVTCYDSFNIDDVAGLIDKLNDAELGGAAAETLKFIGCKSAMIYEDRALFQIKYFFEYNPEGWNGDRVMSQKFIEVPTQVVQLLPTGATASPIKYSVLLRDKAVGTGVTRRMYDTASFSVLNGFLYWEP